MYIIIWRYTYEIDHVAFWLVKVCELHGKVDINKWVRKK